MRYWPAAFLPCVPPVASAWHLAVAPVSRCLFGPCLCVLRARRAALILCPRRGRWPYPSSLSGAHFWTMGYHCCIPALASAWPLVYLHVRAVPRGAFGKSCCVPPLSSARPLCRFSRCLYSGRGWRLCTLVFLLCPRCDLAHCTVSSSWDRAILHCWPVVVCFCFSRHGLWPFLLSLAPLSSL